MVIRNGRITSPDMMTGCADFVLTITIPLGLHVTSKLSSRQ